MSQKFACIVVGSDKEFEQLMKENEQLNIERGLKASLNIDMHKELSYMFEKLSEKGYHITGFVLSENKNIEFMFQRNPNQKQKLREIAPPDKYKM